MIRIQNADKFFNKNEFDSQGLIGENSLDVVNVSKPTAQEFLCGGLWFGCS